MVFSFAAPAYTSHLFWPTAAFRPARMWIVTWHRATYTPMILRMYGTTGLKYCATEAGLKRVNVQIAGIILSAKAAACTGGMETGKRFCGAWVNYKQSKVQLKIPLSKTIRIILPQVKHHKINHGKSFIAGSLFGSKCRPIASSTAVSGDQ